MENQQHIGSFLRNKVTPSQSSANDSTQFILGQANEYGTIEDTKLNNTINICNFKSSPNPKSVSIKYFEIVKV